MSVPATSLPAAYPLPDDLAEVLANTLDLGNACLPAHLFGDRKNAHAPPPFDDRLTWTRGEGEGAALEFDFFGELQLSASALIHDGRYGSLGLIHHLPAPGEPLPDGALKSWIRDHLETATYLRHLCLEKTPPHQPHFAVEVVFITSATSAAMEQDLASVLLELMEQTSLMHAIGIGVLKLDPTQPSGAMGQSIYRAFPWLLTATRQWLAERDQVSDTASADAPDLPPAPLSGLFLQDFRVAGSRRLTLQKDARIHLIHGQNGSGKSSLSEALELIATGKIERLGTGADYRETLRNRDALDDSAFAIGAQLGEASRSFDISREGLAEPLMPGLPALSFRLDQHAASDLIRDNAEKRAAHFLDAFFPEHRKVAQNYKRALEEIRSRIPPTLLEGLDDADSGVFDLSLRLSYNPFIIFALIEPHSLLQGWQTKLHGMIGETGSYRFGWEYFVTAIPLYRHLAFPDLKSDREEGFTHAAISGYVDKLDHVWQDLRENAATYYNHLTMAAETLEKLGGWTANDTSMLSQEETELAAYPERVNRWLRESAVHAILSAEEEALLIRLRLEHGPAHEILQKEFPQPPTYMPFPVFFDIPSHALETRHRALQSLVPAYEERRLKARKELDRGIVVDTSKRRGDQQGMQLSDTEVAALNWSGTFLGIQDDVAAGDLIRQALRTGRSTRFSLQGRPDEVLVIGSGSSEAGNRIADEMKKWAATFSRFQQPGILSPQAPSENYQNLQKLSAAMRVAAEHGTRAFEAFQTSVNGPLNHSINELTALMTPARWAYPDIHNRLDGDRFEQEIDGRPAALILNTAELNSSTLSLFLLCAFGRRGNSFRTIMLDDPFENMDELTTTHVARAITRFLRLWNRQTRQDRWQILIFLHGAENVERMRAETPCATYFLPWLTPIPLPDNSGGNSIESEKARFPLLPS